MEEFKKKIQRRLRCYCSLCLLLPGTYGGMRLFAKDANDYAQGLVMGVFCSLMVAMVFLTVRLFMTSRDEEKLRQLYIQETDERNAAISRETMRTASLITLFATCLAVIVSGFINITVSMTLAVSMMASALIAAVVFAFYKKTM